MAVKSKKPSDVIVRIATYFFTALFAVLCVLPMWHVIMASFSDPIQLSLYEGFLFSPLQFSVEGFEHTNGHNKTKIRMKAAWIMQKSVG